MNAMKDKKGKVLHFFKKLTNAARRLAAILAIDTPSNENSTTIYHEMWNLLSSSRYLLRKNYNRKTS
jgi:hypothetical protein